MEVLRNEWFSSINDLKEEIEDLGFTVDEINNELVCISYQNEVGEDVVEIYQLKGTERTIYIDLESKRTDIL